MGGQREGAVGERERGRSRPWLASSAPTPCLNVCFLRMRCHTNGAITRKSSKPHNLGMATSGLGCCYGRVKKAEGERFGGDL